MAGRKIFLLKIVKQLILYLIMIEYIQCVRFISKHANTSKTSVTRKCFRQKLHDMKRDIQ